jgi:hypothetical protein
MSFEGQTSFDSWNSHTVGTLSLIKFRGATLLRTEFGRQIYIQVANNVRAICAQRRVALPDGFLELDTQVRPLLGTSHPMVPWWSVLDMSIRLRLMEDGE